MLLNFKQSIISYLEFLSGITTRQLVSQVNELKVGQNELRVGQNELKVGQNELKVGQERATETIFRGLAMIINTQNKTLERLDDIEARLKEIKEEKRFDG